MKADGGDFVSGGNLGYMNFPPVEGGKGDPSNTVGNPGQYLSISSKATRRAEGDREEVLRHRACSTTTRSRSGSTPAAVPIVKGAEKQLAASEDAEFLKFVYDIASNAKVVRASPGTRRSARPPPRRCWTTSPSCSSCPITPQQFADNMNEVIGK